MARKKLVIIYALHQAIHWFIVGIGIPFIILLFQARGLELGQIGLVMACWIGSTALFEVPFGGVADRHGRKVVYQLSMGVNCIGTSSLLFASSLLPIIAAVVLLGLSRALYSGTLDAWFYDRFIGLKGNFDYFKATSIVSVFITIGLSLGALTGSYLPSYLYDLTVYLGLSEAMEINLIVIVALTMFLIVATHFMIAEEIIKDDITSATEQKLTFIQHSMEVLKSSANHPVLKWLLMTTAFYGAVLASVETYWQPQLRILVEQEGLGLVYFGILSSLYFLMSASSSLVSMLSIKLFNGSHRMLLTTSRAIAGGLLVLLAEATQVFSFSLAYLLFFFLFTLGASSERTLLHQNTESRYRSQTLSIVSLSLTLGSVLASLVFSLIADEYGIRVVWLACGVILATSSSLFMNIPSRCVPQSKSFSSSGTL